MEENKEVNQEPQEEKDDNKKDNETKIEWSTGCLSDCGYCFLNLL